MNDKIKYKAILILLLITAGIFIFVFPAIENKLNNNKKDAIMKAIEEGKEVIEIKLPKDNAVDDVYNLDIDTTFIPLITHIPTVRPLNDKVVDEVQGIGIIEIKKISLKLPIVEGVDSKKLKVAVVHVPMTSAIGTIGNSIIVGHRNYTYGEMFNRLDEVDVGDIIKITMLDGTEYKYKVYATTVIEPGDSELFDFEPGQKKLTLLTCTPVRKATHRLLVIAELME